MWKKILPLTVVFMALGAVSASGGQFEPGTDRGGSDYRSFDLSYDSPELCQRTCRSEQRCKAWTYVRPGVQGPRARCWLKHSVPAPRANNCCVSGVTGAVAGGRVIHNPTIRGVALDVCLTWAAQCGKPAADAYCRQAGYGASISYQVRHDSPPTLVIGTGQTCTGSFCDRISQVVCAGGGGGGGLYKSRWDKIGGPGGSWTTGWVPNHTFPGCGRVPPSCGICPGTNPCGNYSSGAVVTHAPYGVQGNCSVYWQLKCTSVPQ